MTDGLSRRQVLGCGAAAAAAAATTSCSRAAASAPARRAVSVCRICTVTCGIDVWVEGDRVTQVYGKQDSPTRGFVCANGLALPEILASPRRVRRPQVRRNGRLRPASWDEALSVVAEGLGQVRERHGAKAVAIQTGWALVYRNIVGWIKRFADAVGTPNVASSSSICVAASRMASQLTFGRIGAPDIARTELCLTWGWNPMFAAPPLANVLLRKQARGMRLVSIDPYRTFVASRADAHLPIRPGRDLALALAMLGVIVRERLYDEQVVTASAVGFDELAAAVEPLTSSWGAEQTGLEADVIEDLARDIASAEAACGYTGVALEQALSGLQTCRAVDALWAITGNAGRPGGKRLLRRAGTEAENAARALEPTPGRPEDPAVGATEHPLFAELVGEAQGSLYPAAVLDGTPYPVKALMVIGANPVLSAADTDATRRSLEQLDLLVVADPMMTETAELADVVLPVATFLESDDYVAMRNVGEVEAAVPPAGDAWPDWKIVFELARRMDLGRFFPWETGREARQAQAQAMARAGGPSSQEFPTPSGKIELASERMREAGQPPTPRPQAMPMPSERFPLMLTTGARQAGFCNSQVRGIPMVEARVPTPAAEVSTVTAREAGLEPGSRARLETAHGHLEVSLRVLDGLRPGVVRLAHCLAEANANVLTSVDERDPGSGFVNFRAIPCRLAGRRS